MSRRIVAELAARVRRMRIPDLSREEYELVRRIEEAGLSTIPGVGLAVSKALTRRRLERRLAAERRNAGGATA